MEELSKTINTYARKHLETISRNLNLNHRSQSEKIPSYWKPPYDNSFCAETEVAVQVLKLAQSMNLDRVTIEGDALNVIMTFSGMSKVED